MAEFPMVYSDEKKPAAITGDNMTPILKILIADDHEIVRRGLRYLILAEFPFAQIEECSDGETLIEKSTQDIWNIILSDINMPGIGGVKAISQIKLQQPELPVLVLSIQTGEQYSKSMQRAGASGYLSKDASPKELITAINTLLQGKKYFPVSPKEDADEDDSLLLHERLTIRELEIFKSLAAGKSLVEIAEIYSISPSTVSTFRARILKKMDLTNNADLTRYAIKHKMT